MLLLEKDQDVFKQWVLPKLEKMYVEAGASRHALHGCKY